MFAMRIEEIEKKLKKAEHEYAVWRKAVSVYERCKAEPIGEFPESAYRAYIVTGSVTDAAQALNNAGQRNGTKKFISNDISETISGVDIEDTDIVEVARFLLSGGRDFANFLFN